jgi:hypothetical protein
LQRKWQNEHEQKFIILVKSPKSLLVLSLDFLVLVLSQTVGTASALGFFVGIQRGLRFGAPHSVVHNLQMTLHVLNVLHIRDTVGQLGENLLC